MKIITWNVLFYNRHITKGITAALAMQPDILCLQEVPDRILSWLKNFPSYTLTACYDFSNPNPKKNAYICTLTKQKPLKIKEVVYDHKEASSLMSTLVYNLLFHDTERHTGLLVNIKSSYGPVQIANIRLSCAVSTRDRIGEFRRLLTGASAKASATIFCGDFNVMDSHWLNRMTGWLRGFESPDYKINEREKFEKIFREAHLLNIFSGIQTVFIRRPLLQLDHILIPAARTLVYKEVIKNRYGSDHHMLLAEVK